MFNNLNKQVIEWDLEKGILFDTKNHKSVGIVISDAAYDTDEFAVSGRKIARAGMPYAGDLLDRITPFVQATATAASTITVEDTGGTQQTINVPATSNAQGVLWHDVDVTAGPANATLIVEGHINRDRLNDFVEAFYVANEGFMSALHDNVKFYRDN